MTADPIDYAPLHDPNPPSSFLGTRRYPISAEVEEPTWLRDTLDPANAGPDREERPEEPAERPIGTLTPRTVASGAEPEPLIGESLDAFLARDTSAVVWFGPIVDGGVAVGVGRPETFKTFAALQLGLAGAAGDSWLGMDLGEPRPFVYVAAEKARATIRDRLGRMIETIRPSAPVQIIHRGGVSFGDPRSWGAVVNVVRAFGRRTFVVLDTLASLAGPGFDENSGRDMAVVLAATRRLGDLGATVLLLHHPPKHGDGSGGIRLRGHTSLWGEIDATLEFTRPSRDDDAAMLRVEPKDGDLRLVSFRWSRETFLVEPETGVAILTATRIATVVGALYEGQGLTSDAIRAKFPGHGKSAFMDRLAEAVQAGLIARVGAARMTRYVPTPDVMRPEPDEWGSGPDDRPSGPDD